MTAPSATRRYLSVWLSRLATDRIARSAAPDEAHAAHVPAKWAPVRRQEHAPLIDSRACPDSNRTGHALVVVAPIKSALRLTALNDAAARLGLKTGMALADARAMYPRLDVKDADPLADRHLLETVAEWCDRYTPLVGVQPPDGLILDISGCAHLFGGEAALCDDLVRRLGAQGLLVRAAIADTVGCAWALARYGDETYSVRLGCSDAQLAPTSPRVREDNHIWPALEPQPQSLATHEPLAPPPLEKGRSVREADRVGIAFMSRFDPHPPPPAKAGIGDLPFSRGGGASGIASSSMRGNGEQADSACSNNSLIVPIGRTREALAPLPLAA